MAHLTKEFLINSLHNLPKTEAEVGFNAAIIMILKKIVESVENDAILKSALTNTYDTRLFDAFVKNGHGISEYSKLSESTKKELKDAVDTSSKLHAVKILKDATGLGLKQSKDIIDSLYS